MRHLFPVPWGLWGAARDIGLAYPELGEPAERLAYALGDSLAREFHAWGKEGIERISQQASELGSVRRGSRLSLCRQETEAALLSQDALQRQAWGDEVRLMSGAAASNYAPLATSVALASFETQALSFVPATLSETLQERLRRFPKYIADPLESADWEACRVETTPDGVRALWPAGQATAEVAVLAAGHEIGQLIQAFRRALVPLLGQAFRSEPLAETTRASVVGLTASWGYERYRFDEQRRLLACGLDPVNGTISAQPEVLAVAQEALWKRATTLLSDLARSGPDVLRWGVLFTATCDGLPLLGPLPGEPRIHVVTGFGTSAWSRGYRAGELIADHLLGEPNPSPLIARCSPRRLIS